MTNTEQAQWLKTELDKLIQKRPFVEYEKEYVKSIIKDIYLFIQTVDMDTQPAHWSKD